MDLFLPNTETFDTDSYSFVPQEVYIVKGRDIAVECLELIESHAYTVLNCGVGSKRFNKWLEHYAYLFKDKRYLAFDIVPNSELDWCSSLEYIPLRNESIDSVICWSVLEHVFEPQHCVEEIYRILKPNGLGLFQIPMWYPLHGNIRTVDCYRFTLYGLLYCFRQFRRITIQPIDDYSGVLTRMLLGYNKSRFALMLQKIIHPIITEGIKFIKRRTWSKCNEQYFWMDIFSTEMKPDWERDCLFNC